MGDGKMTIHEPSRDIPVAGEYDVVVVGGGLAGVAAAVAAGRNGARVALVEKENTLGGLATLGLVVIYLPICDGMGTQVIGGLGEEMLRLSIKYGPGEIPTCWNGPADVGARCDKRFLVRFNPASYIIALDELVLSAGVEILFDTRLCQVSKVDGRIDAVIVENKSGRSALRCKTVVDASGDADVCHLAGEPTAVLTTNTRAAWFYYWDGSANKLQQLHDRICPDAPGDLMTFRGDTGEGVTRLNIESRKMTLEKMRELCQGDFTARYPVLLPTFPQFRMTRRLRGELEIDEADDHRWFDDCIGLTGDWRKAGPVLFLPYRTLRAVTTSNLLVAGRCISATRSAWDITRAIPACVVTGEAAGTAAALCAQRKQTVGELDIDVLQAQLRAQKVILDKSLARR